MRKIRGFRLGRKLVKLWKWALKPKCRTRRYLPFTRSKHRSKMLTKLCNWGRRVGASLCPSRRPLLSHYCRLGEEKGGQAAVAVPKGHLAVYVGQRDDDMQRYLVPVLFFNHPLFGQLLREAEQEFGFHHQGGITIPCRVSDFESVQMKIAAGEGHPKAPRKRLF